jgi:hypothetical protein
MMGMGFLRLNKMLAKHKWRRGKDEPTEEEQQESTKSSVTLWLAVMALMVIAVLVFALLHTRQIL